MRYENGKPVEATQIVVSHQHVVEVADVGGRRQARPALRRGGAAEGLDHRQHRLAHQPDRQVLHRRPRRRLRPHRPQDHRRHLRRRGAARRRRLLRQGSDQGRPLRRLRRPLSGQERRRRRSRRPLHAAAFLRDRRGAAAVDLRRPARHRADRRGQARKGADGDHEPHRRAASASTSSSTGRSTPAPRPTAISAARPTPTAASPGRRPIMADTLRRLA